MKLVKWRSDGGMEMGGPHAPDSSQRSQLQPSPMSWYTMAPTSEGLGAAMPLTWAEKTWSSPRWP
eukprot:4285827-Prymnesium_polylepis.1